MRANKPIASAAACMGFLLLILDSKTALTGAREGITLAATVLVPSLFPFLFLSIFLTGSLQGVNLPLLKPIGRFLHIPEGMEGIFLSSFLGGYPAGAQAVSQAYHSGTLSKENAEKMLSFSNNAGPSFLFGMASACFSDIRKVWLLWILHILGAVAAARLNPCCHEKIPDSTQAKIVSSSQVLKEALNVMGVICGWVILFRVVIAFSDRWFLQLLPNVARTAVIGLLELSNGICELNAIADEKIRFLICSGILSLGGICVTMQTYSVTDGLNKRYYFRGKHTQLLVSLSLSAAFMYRGLFWLPLLVLPLIPIHKNKGGNPAAVGV